LGLIFDYSQSLKLSALPLHSIALQGLLIGEFVDSVKTLSLSLCIYYITDFWVCQALFQLFLSFLYGRSDCLFLISVSQLYTQKLGKSREILPQVVEHLRDLG
jgi:hypothetical protein